MHKKYYHGVHVHPPVSNGQNIYSRHELFKDDQIKNLIIINIGKRP